MKNNENEKNQKNNKEEKIKIPEKEEPKIEKANEDQTKNDKKIKNEEDNLNEDIIKTKIDANLGMKNVIEDKDIKSNAETWDDLRIKESLKKALLDMGFIEPSQIQSLSFPLIMKEPRLSLIAQAKNGSGKTCAFGLGVISTIDENLNDIQAVILSPHRELVTQITGVIEQMAKNSKIKVTSVLPGVEIKEYGQIIVTNLAILKICF